MEFLHYQKIIISVGIGPIGPTARFELIQFNNTYPKKGRFKLIKKVNTYNKWNSLCYIDIIILLDLFKMGRSGRWADSQH